MTYELSTDEKVSIVNQHLRNISFKKYNLDLSLVEEQALSAPNQERIAVINSDMAEVVAQTAALLLELESLV
jgi:uncharacterized lipoprotein YajG